MIRSQNIILYPATLITSNVAIPAKAGIQKNTGFRAKPGMTNQIRPMSLYIICTLTIALLLTMTFLLEIREVHAQLKKKPALSQEMRKDPFSMPPGVRLLSKETPVKEEKTIQPIAVVKPNEIKPAETPLTLKAILISDHVRLASIDRSIVTVGDTVNGEKILEIRPDRVILEKEGKKRTVLLDQSPVKLAVEER